MVMQNHCSPLKRVASYEDIDEGRNARLRATEKREIYVEIHDLIAKVLGLLTWIKADLSTSRPSVS